MKNKKWPPKKEKLKKLYHKQKMSLKEISNIYGKARSTINYYFNKYNLKTRSKHLKKHNKKCEYCGKSFIGYYSSKYCSQKCKYQASKIRRGKRKCKKCNKYFFPSFNEQKYCSQQCGSEAAALTMKNKIEKKKCIWCGDEFKNDWAHRYKKYCSKKCSDAAWSRKYRARKKNAFVEEVPFDYIFKRDNGICQICGKKVLKKYKFPHTKSPSIDHIIPLSKNGKHSKKNCQLTHWGCNNKKSDGSVGSKLRLFG